MKIIIYIIAILLMIISCFSDNDDFLEEEKDGNCPAVLSEFIKSKIECKKLDVNSCSIEELRINLNLKCTLCKSDSAFQKYKRIHLYFEDPVDRKARLIDSTTFNNEYEASVSFCVEVNPELKTQILSYELLKEGGDWKTGAMAFDNICIDSNNQVTIDRDLTTFDFYSKPDCLQFNKFVLSEELDLLEDTLYIIESVVIGSVGYGYSTGKLRPHEFNFEEMKSKFAESYKEYYEIGTSMPCSGTYIRFIK